MLTRKKYEETNETVDKDLVDMSLETKPKSPLQLSKIHIKQTFREIGDNLLREIAQKSHDV